MLGGAALAFYHAGVEQGWWAGPDTCVAARIDGLSTAELIARIKAAPLVRCDEIPWSFLGLSMAAWNAVAQVVLAAMFARAARGGASTAA
jgi:disulfide bond formation protein DsbB